MSSISYILAYLSGPSLYRIYRQARLVSITTLYNNPNVGKTGGDKRLLNND